MEQPKKWTSSRLRDYLLALEEKRQENLLPKPEKEDTSLLEEEKNMSPAAIRAEREEKEAMEALRAAREKVETPIPTPAGEALSREGDAALRRGEESRRAANGQNAALGQRESDYFDQQDGRYEALLREVIGGNYRNNPAARALLDAYAAEGEKNARHALASAAADNGGNPDSYAAAQAARQRGDASLAGTQAALDAYGKQLDRWLAVLRAAGGDAGDLFGAMQKNADSAAASAKDDLSLGASLLGGAAEAESDARKTNASLYSSLLSQYEKRRKEHNEALEKEAAQNAPSPMQIDREYDAMTTGTPGTPAAYSAVDALIALWEKYPAMRTYLEKKYAALSAAYSSRDD